MLLEKRGGATSPNGDSLPKRMPPTHYELRLHFSQTEYPKLHQARDSAFASEKTIPT